ncbi:heparan-alpha-glucosaminide N-acetyltransferase domain-containing protein [Enterobacter bugandensis]|uniref:DUF1624 domain-containing protein n=1 Tax=Enterobacter bugandensis TaxID=881260 RepID=UPI0020760994|nr:heparan-alpha-glucosaminide N-acetyltransferase domain-containing protein [Enterobacter bugandensis]MCM7239199.1 heparan-alpha-glucosaminide N-acetyltransferase domain-containing protein [Enterobacter bugandensis]MCM7319103.1 heparan-alpha-glucosaminide N-acetyltransferase domain-containing protein [Enterobacter bugandensis]MCM7354570.1 heparan-alpha-glucosaminide N-acetyltransferase domain-containing protein [Enterobacter bugandensis]
MEKILSAGGISKNIDERGTFTTHRIASIDALRGLMMLIMLLDHVRGLFYTSQRLDYPINVDATEPTLFFTRWISHLCAPVFILLTGVATSLYNDKHLSIKKTRQFLLKRGVFLILIEFLLCNFFFLFYKSYTAQLQVIWAIGASMIILSGLLFFPRLAQIIIVIFITTLPHLVNQINMSDIVLFREMWVILYQVPSVLHFNDTITIDVLYPITPWVGVIYGGYLLGSIFSKNSCPSHRIKMLCFLGTTMIIVCIILRLFNNFGDPVPWVKFDNIHTVMSFLNFSKYPPSEDFLLITAGIGLLLLAAIEAIPKKFIAMLSPLIVFGSVPLFFYVLHLYLILALYISAEFFWEGIDKHIGIPSVWFITLVFSLMLYPLCKFFSVLKRTSKKTWMSYL